MASALLHKTVQGINQEHNSQRLETLCSFRQQEPKS